jgi:hypothetical protein
MRLSDLKWEQVGCVCHGQGSCEIHLKDTTLVINDMNNGNYMVVILRDGVSISPPKLFSESELVELLNDV